MDVYKELAEIEDLKEENNNLKDKILDIYKKNPKQCNVLLKDLLSIDEEINNLEFLFKKIDEIH